MALPMESALPEMPPEFEGGGEEGLNGLPAGLGQAPTSIDQPKADRSKCTQAQVLYQVGQRCEECRHFEPPAGCSKVSGTINVDGWCVMHSANAGEREETEEQEEQEGQYENEGMEMGSGDGAGGMGPGPMGA